MARIPILLILAVVTTACVSTPEPLVVTETVEVKVPVYQVREAPEWLAKPYQPGALPVFIAPTAPGATVGLDAEGARLLRELIRNLHERDKAWREWAAVE